MKKARIVGTTEAAKIKGVTPSRIVFLIKSGRLPAEKVGKTWLIQRADLDRLEKGKPGRPKKT